MIGQTVSHYRILEPLGEGGMGTVYLAEDTHLGRRVAVKFPSLSSDTHDYRARFLREARAVSELSHPGIATLFDYGETDEGRPFLVMELARGRPLTYLMQQGELSLLRAVEIVTDIAAALVVAHARGVVHRDIKPSNIMIDDEGKVKVLDFGLAKQLTKDSVPASAPEAQTLLSTETRSGVVLGTPAYLSPEQAVGGAVDGRSDLFALGTLLYEATTGSTPFKGNSFIEIAANVLHVEPTPPTKINHQVPRELEFIILKALNKKPNKRYQSAKELIADLKEVKKRLEEASGHTLIRQTSPSMITATNKTLSNLSQILQRPRIPISYILIGAVLLIAAGGVALRFARPSIHTPTPEAQRWYGLGTNALREGAYYQASKAFEKAIASDDAYMLAHARLAEALVELDNLDRAKDELLRVSSDGKTALSPIDALYLDAITATVRHDFPKAVSLYGEIVKQATDAEKPYALVDLGRAHDKNGDTKRAIEAYTEASNRNGDYPTPFLQLGILYARQAELPSALSCLGKAEAIYQATGNLEGRSEVVFQRGALFNKVGKLADAKAQLEQALQLTRASDNKSQEIKTLLQLNSVAVDLGEIDQATEYLRQALALAQSNGMETLSVRALNDQGNNALIKSEYTKADKYFTDALQLALRSKAVDNLARARFSLASVRLRQNNPDEALSYLEPALAFYQQGGYRSEIVQCLTLQARANRHKGDYESALKSNEQLLQLGQQTNDQSQIAQAHGEMANVLARQEKYPEALEHDNQAYAFYNSQGIQRSLGTTLLTRGDALWRMGRYAEAQPLLDQAQAIAEKPGSEIKRLAIGVDLAAAEIALSEGHFADAKTKAENVLAKAGTEFRSATTSAKLVLGLAQSYSGGKAAGKRVVLEAVDLAKEGKDPAQLAVAQLVLAEVLLIAGDFNGASSNALLAREVFELLAKQESQWRACLIAAQASQNMGDKTKAREYAVRAGILLSKLEQRWGSENYNSYLRRADIQRLRNQLGQLSVGA
jgi:serine/threonine protein kinase/ATP/maltotriose-dependent transcriptional regulator MalT